MKTTTCVVLVLVFATVVANAKRSTVFGSVAAAMSKARSDGLFDCSVKTCAGKDGWCGAKGDNITNCWSPYTCITDGTTSGKCVTHRSKGEHCTVSSDCHESSVVEDGLYCKLGVCMEHAKAGEACQSWEDCDTNLLCDGSICRNIFTRQLGQTCGTTGYDMCITTLQCSNNVCAPFAKLGEPCTSGECAVEGQCVSGVCRPWYSAKEGENCLMALSCADGLVCGTKSTCVAAGASAGTTCTEDSECPANNFCKCDWDSGKSKCMAKEPATASTKTLFDILQKCFILNQYDSTKCKKETAAVFLAIPEFQLLVSNPCLTQ